MNRSFQDPTQLMTTWARAVTDNAPHLPGDVFAVDAEFVNLFGSIWRGREATIDGHAQALGGVLKDSTMDFDSADSRTRRGLRSESATSRPAPGSGTRSSIACSASSASTGAANRSKASKSS